MCDHGYLDSFSYVSFLVFIEETYGVRIPDHQLTGKLKTVSAVADFVLRGSQKG
jgi:acyl carrier protein